MPPLVISRDNITIGGKIIETAQSIGLSKQVAVNPLLNTFIEEPVFNDTSLIAHYKFDGNYNDSSGNNHNLTNNGSSLQSTHIISGQAVDFDNTDYLEFPSTINPYTIWNGNGITFAFWVKISVSGEWVRFIDFQPTTSVTTGICIVKLLNTNKIRFISGPIFVDVDMIFNNNLWQHISFSISRSSGWTIYINGVNQNVNVVGNVANIAYNLRYINMDVYSNFTNSWDGQMDDFRIYNKVLTHAEITSLYFSKNTLVPITINADYKYMSFVNTGANQSQYSITFNENTECDILIVGGGGGGGTTYRTTNSGVSGGGGGAGGLIFLENQIVQANTYIIQVGKGGDGDNFNASTLPNRGKNGNNSSFSYHPTEAVGGGGGGSRHGNENGADGGSGGGRAWQTTGNGGQGIYGQGFSGATIAGSGGNGLGGGGAGKKGSSTIGGVGKFNEGNFNFKERFNLPTDNSLGEFFNGNVYFAGGGSGGENFTDGGKGGGASGSVEGTGLNGLNNTGGGGGGCRAASSISGERKLGGNGGSGIVLIRYKTTKNIVPININEDYKYFSLTYNDIPDVVYDFTPYNDLQSWISYANSFGATTNVTSFDSRGVWVPNTPIGEITYPLSNNYNYIDVIFSNPINSGNVNLYIDNVLKMSTTGIQTRTYSDTYTTGQILKIDETNSAMIGKNLIIKLSRIQSQYSITFNENTECDILIVGGGGGGGRAKIGSTSPGGGGGAGGLIFLENQLIPTGSYIINVGKGGEAITSSDTSGNNGNNSSFNYIQTEAVGGGGGGTRYEEFETEIANGNDGGSGGGSVWPHGEGGIGTVSDIIKYDGTTILFSYRQGFDGGDNVNSDAPYSGGGGGAGGAGKNSNEGTIDGDGGIGKSGEGGIDFKTFFNILSSIIGELHTDGKVYFAGGGGSGERSGNIQSGGLGGGGYGLATTGSQNGKNNSGGGGAGGRSDRSIAVGSGGSGIVIIRYKKIAAPFDAQWTYNSINSSVYHLGNVGIGTINPTSVLDVLGSVVVNGGIISTSLEANTKNFKIAHPLGLNKWLYHGCVEGPRFDNMYRGKKMVINGSCEVDIDIECNTTGGMTAGTFMALNNNFSLHLQNKNSFDGVKGEVIDGKIIITCENIAEEIEVEWLVIGERHDEGIVRNNLTNNEGMLICEHEY